MSGRMNVKSPAHVSKSSSKWNTQSNWSRDSPGKVEKPNDLRKKLKERLRTLLDKSYPKSSILKTHDTADKIMDEVERYCSFDRSSSKSSNAIKTSTSKPNASKPMDSPKSHGTAKSSTAAKLSSATASFIVTESSSVKKSSNVAKSFTVTKFYDRVKPSTVSSSCTAQNHFKSGPNTPKRNKVQQSISAAELELKRLTDSDGFVTTYPARYKRVPKPVERFSIQPVEPKARRRSSRSRSEKTDVVDEIPKEKFAVAENVAVFKVQRTSQTVTTETTSTTVSTVTGAGTSGPYIKAVATTQKTANQNFNYK